MSDPGSAGDDELVADWQRIRAGAATVQRRLDHAVEAAGVPAQWFAVLHMLRAAPEQGLPMTVLARDLAMTSGGFTKLVDRMAKEGLVDRRGNAADRRVVHAALTELGREAGSRAEGVYLQALRNALLTHVERAELTDAGRMLYALAQANADGGALGDSPVGGANAGEGADGHGLLPEAALHEAHFDDPAHTDPALLTTQRDPALPERRGRGRVSE